MIALHHVPLLVALADRSEKGKTEVRPIVLGFMPILTRQTND